MAGKNATDVEKSVGDVEKTKSKLIEERRQRIAKGAPLPEDVDLEREFRRYVKRSGGFRRDLPASDKKKAQDLQKQLGKPGLTWDFGIIVPGIDQPTVKSLALVGDELVTKKTVKDAAGHVRSIV